MDTEQIASLSTVVASIGSITLTEPCAASQKRRRPQTLLLITLRVVAVRAQVGCPPRRSHRTHLDPIAPHPVEAVTSSQNTVIIDTSTQTADKNASPLYAEHRPSEARSPAARPLGRVCHHRLISGCPCDLARVAPPFALQAMEPLAQNEQRTRR